MLELLLKLFLLWKTPLSHIERFDLLKNNKMHTNHMYECYMNSDAYLIFFLLFWQFQKRIFYCEILDSVLKLEP